jgi:hypothetical protein
MSETAAVQGTAPLAGTFRDRRPLGVVLGELPHRGRITEPGAEAAGGTGIGTRGRGLLETGLERAARAPEQWRG